MAGSQTAVSSVAFPSSKAMEPQRAAIGRAPSSRHRRYAPRPATTRWTNGMSQSAEVWTGDERYELDRRQRPVRDHGEERLSAVLERIPKQSVATVPQTPQGVDDGRVVAGVEIVGDEPPITAPRRMVHTRPVREDAPLPEPPVQVVLPQAKEHDIGGEADHDREHQAPGQTPHGAEGRLPRDDCSDTRRPHIGRPRALSTRRRHPPQSLRRCPRRLRQ